MPDIRTTENEFRSQAITWLNEFIQPGTTPFEVATADPSLKSSEGVSFPDIQIWLHRQAQQGFCGWELKTPKTSAGDQDLLENAAQKARAMGVDYFVTWNMREAILWQTPEKDIKVGREHRVKNYEPLHQINNPEDLWVESKKILLKRLSREILDDLITLHQKGHLHLVEVDATFFVKKLAEAARTLIPFLHEALEKKVGSDRKFGEGLIAWARKQGIREEEEIFYVTISRQLVYRILGRILFYQTLRRFNPHLPKLSLSGIKPTQGHAKLKEFFEAARAIDYQAVFEEDFTDRVGIPPEALEVLSALIDDLNKFNFSRMPQDVIGQVFEKLIPYEERHLLGQYFTPEDLVDLINAFCIRTKTDKILDPTCGTGTFLIRAYHKLKHRGELNHKNLLSRLWGIDIARFPAELATINLFRQKIEDYDNFPRILSEDVFEVVPGSKHKFPPPKYTGDPNFMIEEVLPEFDGMAGNFPYIRQELIEKKVPGYKQKLKETIVKDWHDYLAGDLKLSGQADIYAYLFFHTARFLKKDGGRLGIVTSNSWLDVAYGYELQRFFLNNFKIVAILESRCEPWFEDPAVNTIVTILERCENNKEDRKEHMVKFVKVKKKLKDLIPYDMETEAINRFGLLDRLTLGIEQAGAEYFKVSDNKVVNTLQGIKTYEDENFRIRLVKQGELLEEAEKAQETIKWGKYLRAPAVYFEILEKCCDDLVPLNKVADIKFGIKTGINEYFYLTDDRIKHWKIEKEFLAPVIKSPKDFDGVVISSDEIKKLKTKVFLCNLSKTELRKKGKSGALEYIKWGEKRITKAGQKESGGVLYPEVMSVQGREFWYSIGIQQFPDLIWVKGYDKTFKVGYCKKKVFLDQQLYPIYLKDVSQKEIIAAVMNSTWFFLNIELCGRIPFGEGVLWTTVEEAGGYTLIPKLQIFKKRQKDIIDCFNKIMSRSTESIFEEVKMKDRQKLDSLVLEAMGLDPKKYLKPLYEGLCGLVKERLGLAKMRKNAKNAKTKQDINKLKEQVIEEVVPNGVKIFPEEFLPVTTKKYEVKEISIPQEPLKLGHYFMGQQELTSEGGFKYQAHSVDEAKFIIFAQKPNSFIVKIPKDKIVLQKTVSAYEKYLKELKDKFFQAIFFRTHDHKQSESLTRQVFEELGLPENI